MNSPSEKPVALLTGATSGFGRVIARHLVEKGYRLIILARSGEKADALKKDLEGTSPNGSVEFILCDLSSFSSVVKACGEITSRCTKLDLMVLNAGLWNFKFIETENKIEETLQVNVLSPVLIFLKLQHLLPRDNSAKVIFTSSGLHQGEIYFNDVEFRKSFSGFKAYRQSKAALILMTRLFAKQPEYTGISFYAVHPGLVSTNLGRNAGWLSNAFFKLFGRSLENGAKTHLYLIDQSAQNLLSGEYYADSKLTQTTAYTYNLDEARKLHQLILKYLGTFVSDEK